eukprot:8763424-Pyramimonas_sp.AAC.2
MPSHSTQENHFSTKIHDLLIAHSKNQHGTQSYSTSDIPDITIDHWVAHFGLCAHLSRRAVKPPNAGAVSATRWASSDPPLSERALLPEDERGLSPMHDA